MVVSERTLTWAMRFYPPLMFQRIWVRKFYKGFTGAEVKIHKSLFNINYNRSIFGGSIFSASDPIYAILFDQILQRRGYKVRVWLKSASINYLKPGRTDLYMIVNLSTEEIEACVTELNTVGKFVKAFPIEIKNKAGELCAVVSNEVYVRKLHSGETEAVAY